LNEQLSHAGAVTARSHAAASRLVLSLFPGAGLLDRGFEQAGFCVVRGPDTLLGQRIENFHAPEGHFIGIIGGPPCQDFSRARRAPPTGHGLAMLKEFGRLVTEAQPLWWLMENVPQVPSLEVHGYAVQRFNLFAAEFGVRQSRNRAFQFGSRDGVPLVLRRSESHFRFLAPTVMARDRRRTFADRCELQGLPRSFDLPGLSCTAKIRAIGNGVPVPMAAAVAVAIRDRGDTEERLCICNCGRPVTGRQVSATPACRKRVERSRHGVTPGTVTIGTPVAAPCPDANQRSTGLDAKNPIPVRQRGYGALQHLAEHSLSPAC
jgi:DNA (cytosine-5)-methyltransferase 1